MGPLSALDVDDGLATAGGGLNLGAPPAVQAAGILTNLMHSAGIQVGGGPTSGQTPSWLEAPGQAGIAAAGPRSWVSFCGPAMIRPWSS